MLSDLAKWLCRPVLDRLDALSGQLAAIHRTEAYREAHNLIAVEFTRELTRQAQEWSEPVSVRFVQMENSQWTMEFRDARLQVHEQAVAERAARQ